jgi:hypothetical protein
MLAPVIVPGIVREGIVIPQSDAALPEGAHVDIVIGPPSITPELAAEFASWEQASDEAWRMIDDLERSES